MLDLTRPDAQHLMAVAAEIWERTIATKTPAEIAAMKAKNEENRKLVMQMFAGRVQPIFEGEREHRWIGQCGQARRSW